MKQQVLLQRLEALQELVLSLGEIYKAFHEGLILPSHCFAGAHGKYAEECTFEKVTCLEFSCQLGLVGSTWLVLVLSGSMEQHSSSWEGQAAVRRAASGGH